MFTLSLKAKRKVVSRVNVKLLGRESLKERRVKECGCRRIKQNQRGCESTATSHKAITVGFPPDP